MPPDEFYCQYNKPDDKKEYGYPVDAMHVFYPLGFGGIGILFL